jgi:hypothetical protein
MTEDGMNNRSNLDMGEVGDVTGGASVTMATETAITMTPINANTSSTAALEPTERNDNNNRRRSETPVAAMCPRDWRSSMERVFQQQPCKIAELHHTVAMMATMLGMQTVLQKTYWRSMSTWLEEERKSGRPVTRTTYCRAWELRTWLRRFWPESNPVARKKQQWE